MNKVTKMTKDFSVFDCDAHIVEVADIWDKYVPESEKELVRRTYWRGADGGLINGTMPCQGAAVGNRSKGIFPGMYNPGAIAGPGMSKAIMRKLISMVPLSEEQLDYVDHKGAYDPHARVRDLDLMGIDQVLVIPTTMLADFPFVEDPHGAAAFTRAYNNWLLDWCGEAPGRLYGAAVIPVQGTQEAVAEIYRAAENGLPVGLVRPIDARGAYPNDIGLDMGGYAGSLGSMDAVFRAFEETGVCLGMHTFPVAARGRTAGPGLMSSITELIGAAGVEPQTLGFIHEMQTWLGQVLLAGFLDRYPKLKMVIFEANSQWLPYLLDTCDRLFKLYANERQVKAERLPSEAFYEQCAISFESDEEPTFRQWSSFEDIGIWASDAYHHDGADAWSAIRLMTDVGVPDAAQRKLLGENARRLYNIEEKLFVTEQETVKRPKWFPAGPDLDRWAEAVAHPRQHRDELRDLGLEEPLPAMARRVLAAGTKRR